MSIGFFEELNKKCDNHEKMRVIGYSRVSTQKEAQLDSLKQQEQAIIDFCNKYDLELLANYMESISGKSNLREEYSKLLNDIKELNVDYVIVKDDSRLNRSNENANEFLRILRQNKVKVYSLMDNMTIDPSDNDDIFKLQLNSIFAERYIRELSEKEKYAHKKKREKRLLSRQNECFGYRFNDETRQMEIEPFEGEIIKKIFEMYVYQDLGSTTISKKLYDMGVGGFGNSKYISEPAILKYLRNTAYIGDMTFNHYNVIFETGNGAKTIRHYNDKSDYCHASVPPIVDEELFNLAQRKLNERREVYDEKFPQGAPNSSFKGNHLFSHKIICGECGLFYIFKQGGRMNHYNYYYDSKKKRCQRKNKAKGFDESSFIECSNPHNKILEETLVKLVEESISLSSQQKEECFNNLLKALEYATSNSDNTHTSLEILEKQYSVLQTSYTKALKKLSLLDDLLFDDFKKVIEEDKEKLDNLAQKIAQEKRKQTKLVNTKDKMKDIKKAIQSIKSFESLTRDEILRYVDIIKINSNGTIDIVLNIGGAYAFPINSFFESNVGNNSTLAVPC